MVDSVEPGSLELERRRRYFVTEAAIAKWCAARESTTASLAETLPAGRNDILRRLARIEITAGVNGLCAELADHVRGACHAELVDARSLPLRARAVDRWWLHGVDGYGCLRAGLLHAPFLVAWDRAAGGAHWGATGLPPLLVVCPTTREVAVWRQALAGRSHDESTTPLATCFTTREALLDHGAGGAVWRNATGDEGLLLELIGWGAEPPIAPPPPTLFDAIGTVDRRRHGTIRRWAAQRATADTRHARWQHASALALATGAREQALLEWIARHPLLAAFDLAALCGEAEALIERRLEWLARCHAVVSAQLDEPGTQEGITQMTEEPEIRYVLTAQGMRYLASRAGVAPSTFGKHGGIRYAQESDRDHPERAVRHVEHALGVNRFMVQLARDARERGWMLAEWRNEAESTCRFMDESGRKSWIRPDGSGVIDMGEERVAFLVEYDRGTVDAGDYRGKFEGYRRYYASDAWRAAFEREPVLLFICADDRAERRVLDAARVVHLGIPLFTTAEWRYQEASRTAVPTLDATWYRGAAAFGASDQCDTNSRRFWHRSAADGERAVQTSTRQPSYRSENGCKH